MCSIYKRGHLLFLSCQKHPSVPYNIGLRFPHIFSALPASQSTPLAPSTTAHSAISVPQCALLSPCHSALRCSSPPPALLVPHPVTPGLDPSGAHRILPSETNHQLSFGHKSRARSRNPAPRHYIVEHSGSQLITAVSSRSYALEPTRRTTAKGPAFLSSSRDGRMMPILRV